MDAAATQCALKCAGPAVALAGWENEADSPVPMCASAIALMERVDGAGFYTVPLQEAP